MSDNPGGTPRIGVTTFAQTDQFVMGMMTYLNGLNKMNQKTTETAGSLGTTFAQGSQKAGEAMAQGANQANFMEQTLGTLSLKAIAVAGTLLYLANTAISAVVSKVKELVSGGIMAAARVQELDFILQILGQRVGKTREEMNALVQGLMEAGIRMDIAQTTIQQLVRNELDLASAIDLARVAQDTATIAGVDSSQMLDRLILGITKFDTMILRTGNINIPSTEAAFSTYAETIGKTTAELSTAERMQAMMNAVLEEGKKNAGFYEASMESASKQLRSLGRYTWELSRVMGTPFLGAFSQIVKMMTNVTKMFGKAVDEGGPLHDMFVTAGAVALIFAANIRAAVETGVAWLIQALTGIPQAFNSFIQYVTDLASKSTEWGANIITNFADGMMQAASAVLDALMYIGSMITGWLIPGSPPKLLPNLDKWGAGAATAWVRGWGQADFSTFNDIAKTVEGFLRSSGVEEKNMIPAILGSRKAIAESINMVHEAGMVTEEAIEHILNSAKKLPPQFGEYVRSMLEMESATKRLEDATTLYNSANDLTLENADEVIATFSGDLKNSAEDYVDSIEQVIAVNEELAQAQAELNYITSAYDEVLKVLNDQLDALSGGEEDTRLQEINDALASGQLTAQEQASLLTEKRQLELRKQIAMVEDQRDAEVSAAEERVDSLKEVQDAAMSQAQAMKNAMMEIVTIQVQAAQEQRDALTEQLETQKALVSFQQDQNDLVRQQLDLLERLAEAAAAGAGAGEGAGAAGGGASAFDISGLKDEMQEKITGLSKMMENKFKLFLNNLRARIRLFIIKLPLYKELQMKFAQLKQIWSGTFESLKTWLEVNIPVAITFFSNIWNEKVLPAFTKLKEFYDQYVAPALVGLFGFLTEHGDEIAAFVAGMLLVTGAVTAFFAAGAAIGGILTWVGGLIAGVTALFVALTSPIGLIAIAVGLLAAAWTGNWLGIRDTLTEIWVVTIQPALQTLWEWLSINIPLAIETLRGWWENTLLPALTNFWTWVTENIFPLFATMWEWLSTKVPEAIETLRSWWEDTLLPAFKTAQAWFDETYFPFWEALQNLLEVIVVKAIETLQGKWDDLKGNLTEFWTWLSGTFKPIWDDIKKVLDDIWDTIAVNLNPVFTTMSEVLLGLWGKLNSLATLLTDTLFKAFSTLYNDWLLNIQSAFGDLSTLIQTLTGWFKKLGLAIEGLPPPPADYEHNSPSPFELMLMNVRTQMKALSTKDIPAFATQIRKLPSVGNVTSIPSMSQLASGATTNNYNKNIQLEVNANYAKTQSHASVRHDVTSALMYV